MPSSVIKALGGGKKGEKAWKKAKGIVSKEYPKAKGDKKWKLVTGIAKKIAHKESVVSNRLFSRLMEDT